MVMMLEKNYLKIINFTKQALIVYKSFSERLVSSW